MYPLRLERKTTDLEAEERRAARAERRKMEQATKEKENNRKI